VGSFVSRGKWKERSTYPRTYFLIGLGWCGIAATYFLLGHNGTSRVLAATALVAGLAAIGRALADWRLRRSKSG